MALTAQQRIDVRNELMRLSSSAEWSAIIGHKADLLAVVEAFDDYLDANATAINQSIPNAQVAGGHPSGPRAAFTTAQKARIMAAVALARYGG